MTTTPCNCTGPQGGQPLCPCAMRGVIVKDGRYVMPERDLGPAMPAGLPLTRLVSPGSFTNGNQTCMHDACPNCHGTGRGALGACIHSLVCSCPRCAAR